MRKFFRRKITLEDSQNTGMAMVLLMLILYIALKREEFVPGAIVLHVLNMTAPRLYKPIAVVWLGLAEILGTIVSKVLLAIVFFVVVTPVGILRRWMGKDSLKLRAFKGSEASVMVERNHTYTGSDMEVPY